MKVQKNILVTGAAGTVGKALVKQLASSELLNVVCTDNNESELFFLDQEYLSNPRVSVVMADLRDANAMLDLCEEIDTVYHAAALKHVVLCERNPLEAVQTNILGMQNLIRAANEHNVKKVIFTSSDKAVNPTNVMGTSKLMGERMITAANANAHKGGPVFASTRFGNVLGSRGSVVPIFARQIAQGGPVTITDDEMTRFVMTIDQAAKLVLDSAKLAKGGEVFITKMPVIRIRDLATAMINILAPQYDVKPENVAIETIGSKPGEKLYEELMSDEETRRSMELEHYFAVTPAFRGIYRQIDYQYPTGGELGVSNPYNSANEPKMSVAKIEAFLSQYGVLDNVAPNPYAKRYWPGDKHQK